MKTYIAGTTISFPYRHRNAAGALVDLDAPPTVTIVRVADETAITLNDANMVKQATGTYIYQWDTPDDLTPGWYKLTATGQYQGYDKIKHISFEIVAA